MIRNRLVPGAAWLRGRGPQPFGSSSMKVVLSALWCVVALGAFVVVAQAEEKGKDKPKEVTLKGTILCAKCSLKDAKTCTTAIQVKEGDKTVVYLFDDKGNKEE